MGTHQARKVLCRQISAQEFDDNNHFDGFWLIKNSPEPAPQRGIFIKETTTSLMSLLKSNVMVRWGIRRQVEFLNRQEDSSHLQSSTNFVKGSDFDSALFRVNKQETQLTNISDSIMGMKTSFPIFSSDFIKNYHPKRKAWIQDQIGTLSSMLDIASKTTDCCAEKERNQAVLERCQAVAVVKESVSTGEKTVAEENAAKLQKLKIRSRICKSQGTFLWPNMGANNGSFPDVVQVEDLFMVHTPPSGPSTASAPPQLPYHHPPTSPIRSVPKRRAVEEMDVREPKLCQVVSGLAYYCTPDQPNYCTPDQLTKGLVVLVTTVEPGKSRCDAQRTVVRRLITSVANEMEFHEWQEIIWTELDKVHGVKKGKGDVSQCPQEEDCGSSS